MENVENKSWPLRRIVKWRPKKCESWKTAVCRCENPQDRAAEVDYYLANLKSARRSWNLPEEKKFDTDGNRLPEAKIYQAAWASIDPSKLGYADDEKKIIYLYSQMSAVENFATGIISTQALGAEQIATIAADSQDLPGCHHASWDRKVLDAPFASIIRNGFDWAGGTSSRRSRGLKRLCSVQVRRLISKGIQRPSRKTQREKNSPG